MALDPRLEGTEAQVRSNGTKAVDPPAPKVANDQVENEEATNPTSLKPLLYHGGTVQTSPHIYLVFWGPTWFTGGDPDGVANQLNQFYLGISGSSWANVLRQYPSNYGSFTNPASQYVGWITDTTPITASPSQTDIANAALRAASRVRDYSYNAQFVIAMPWGVDDQYSTSASACGWHKYTYVNSTQWVTYTALPYTPYVDSLGHNYNCGTGKVNGSAGILDGVTINAGHEYAESVLDPSANVYYDTDGSENADKCSWTNLANQRFANGVSYPVQPTWSNTYRTQYGNGCLYSS